MTLADKLAQKIIDEAPRLQGSAYPITQAINEALERAAQEADKYAEGTARAIAKRIRALKG